jgi:CRP-like cAMP-binding protein
MHETLFNYINNYASIPLNEEEKAIIEATFQPKSLRKRQYFLQEGDVCKYGGFLVKGAMRQYTVDDKGVEHMVQLFIENYWVSDRESMSMLTPSIYNIDAWEDSELLITTRAGFLDLRKRVPSFAETLTVMDERHAIASQRRLNSTLSNSAEKRYEEFVNNYPQFLQRFPQHLIASVLGITKETLSRIRKPR